MKQSKKNQASGRGTSFTRLSWHSTALLSTLAYRLSSGTLANYKLASSLDLFTSQQTRYCLSIYLSKIIILMLYPFFSTVF